MHFDGICDSVEMVQVRHIVMFYSGSLGAQCHAGVCTYIIFMSHVTCEGPFISKPVSTDGYIYTLSYAVSVQRERECH